MLIRRKSECLKWSGSPGWVPPRVLAQLSSSAPLDDFADLEARLDAQFAALEGDFAVFEVRPENGFGRFRYATLDTVTSPHPPASHE